MCAISKHISRFFDDPICMINRQTFSWYVISCDKDHVTLRQLLIILTRI